MAKQQGTKNSNQTENIAPVRREAELQQAEEQQLVAPELQRLQQTLANPDEGNPDDIAALQQTVGNRAVTQLFPPQAGIDDAATIQAKLRVGAPGDKYEQEADRMAEKVMSTTVPTETQSGGVVVAQPETLGTVQRVTGIEATKKQIKETISSLKQSTVDPQTIADARKLFESLGVKSDTSSGGSSIGDQNKYFKNERAALLKAIAAASTKNQKTVLNKNGVKNALPKTNLPINKPGTNLVKQPEQQTQKIKEKQDALPNTLPQKQPKQDLQKELEKHLQIVKIGLDNDAARRSKRWIFDNYHKIQQGTPKKEQQTTIITTPEPKPIPKPDPDPPIPDPNPVPHHQELEPPPAPEPDPIPEEFDDAELAAMAAIIMEEEEAAEEAEEEEIEEEEDDVEEEEEEEEEEEDEEALEEEVEEALEQDEEEEETEEDWALPVLLDKQEKIGDVPQIQRAEKTDESRFSFSRFSGKDDYNFDVTQKRPANTRVARNEPGIPGLKGVSEDIWLKPLSGLISAHQQPATVQAKQAATDGGFDVEDKLESRLMQEKSKGQPLPDDVQTDMETRFGADFSQVRVHTGSEAAQISDGLNAQAFTHGNDIFFNAGKSNFGTSDNKKLLAHELTHVIQQMGYGKKDDQRDG